MLPPIVETFLEIRAETKMTKIKREDSAMGGQKRIPTFICLLRLKVKTHPQ
jgi:hypothetical protein